MHWKQTRGAADTRKSRVKYRYNVEASLEYIGMAWKHLSNIFERTADYSKSVGSLFSSPQTKSSIINFMICSDCWIFCTVIDSKLNRSSVIFLV